MNKPEFNVWLPNPGGREYCFYCESRNVEVMYMPYEDAPEKYRIVNIRCLDCHDEFDCWD